MWEGGRPWKTQCWGLQAAAVRPGQAVQNQLSPAPSQGVSYKQKEKAFLIHVLFPLLLWASQALEGGGLWAGSSWPVHGRAEGERLQGPFPLQQFGLRGDSLPSDPQVTLPSLEEQPLIPSGYSSQPGASFHQTVPLRHLDWEAFPVTLTRYRSPSKAPPSSLLPCPTAA